MPSPSQIERKDKLLEIFAEMPMISVPKAAKMVGCVAKTVYEMAKSFPDLDEVLRNKPSTRPGPPPKIQKVSTFGVCPIPHEELAQAEREAFDLARDLIADTEAKGRDRISAANILIRYCQKARADLGRQTVVGKPPTRVLDISEDNTGNQAMRALPHHEMAAWDAAKVAEVLGVSKPKPHKTTE